MKNKTLIIVAVIIIALAVFVVWRSNSRTTSTSNTASSTQQNTQTQAPAPATGETAYTDPGGRFTFNYPSQFSVIGPKTALTTGWRANATTTGYLLATMNVPRSYMQNTNFSDAKLTVGQSNSPTEIGSSGCPSSPAGYTPGTAAAVTINGQTYTKIQSSDAAAGNRYDTTGYYTIRDGDCYAIEYTIHYGNIQNYDPSLGVKEFNESAVAAMLDKVVQSFTFTVSGE